MAGFSAGQTLSCTITKVPSTEDARQTIARLMRNDPEYKRALRKAQRTRRQRLLVYNRGNRDWTSRERVAKVVRVAIGEAWSMPYSADLSPDLSKVGGFLKITAGR